MEAKVITILNKLARKDSATGLDVWYKTVLHNVTYKIQKVTDVNGAVVSMGQTFTILLPFTDNYVPYNEWKTNPDIGYTLSQGDYIFIDVELDENITPNNIQAIRNEYKPNVCEIRSIMEVQKRPGVNYQFKVDGV